MHVHHGSLSSTARYIEAEGHRRLEDHEPEFRKFVRLASGGRPLHPGTRILEVGIGTGWFLILCARHGFDPVGLDISPSLIDFVRDRAEQHGVRLELRLGNIEEAPLAPGSFDVIVADSVFEHVERWREGLAHVAAALRPGGVLIFSSTNRFSIRSGEFPMPFYGWLPDPLRYALRRAIEGPDVMRLGIDFHQFTYSMVRRALTQVGFSRIYDVADLLDPDRLNRPSWSKVALLRSMRRSLLIRRTVLTFWPATELVAVK
jgi:SAM-dependent methyltransferase